MEEYIVNQNQEIISVGELNKSAKYLLENNFSNISVLGEISNISRPSSGHIYFTLKDNDGAIRCAMFKNQNSKLNFVPQNGDQCIIKGQVSIYTPRGDYQLIVKTIEQAGSGNLMKKFEELKKKLEKEGLFDKKYKRKLPKYPNHVCVVTSASTAAFQDILKTIERRDSSQQLSISSAIVQGENASETIINALNRIKFFNKKNKDNLIDAVIIARGGGSIEDLWCFNDESLARTIFNFEIPVISGVGHEIDFTICDFVADIRSPTPTGAAELITESKFKMHESLDDFISKLNKALSHNIDQKNNLVISYKRALKNPLSLLREKTQKLDNLEYKIQQSIKNKYTYKKSLLDNFNSIILEKSPTNILKRYQEKISFLKKVIINNSKNIFVLKEKKLEKLYENLNILSPYSILERGYSILLNKTGVAIKSDEEVNDNDYIQALLHKGKLKLKVKK